MKHFEGYGIPPQQEQRIVHNAMVGFSVRKIHKLEGKVLPRNVISLILNASEEYREFRQHRTARVEMTQLDRRHRSHLMDRIEKAFRCAQSGQTQKPVGTFNPYGDAMDATGTVDRVGIRGVLTGKEFCEDRLYIETLADGRMASQDLLIEIVQAQAEARNTRERAAAGVGG